MDTGHIICSIIVIIVGTWLWNQPPMLPNR